MTDPVRACLFTPGPINTSDGVRRAMQFDMGSRDPSFIEIVRDIRDRLRTLAGAGPDYTTVPVQGSGTFAVEAAIGSLVPQDGRLLVVANGAYGRRMVAIAQRLGIAVERIEWPETEPCDPVAVQQHLATHPEVTHVAAVHCETTTGIINPIAPIGAVVGAAGRLFMVDAMSSLGGMPVDIAGWNVDCLISSANKCLEGVPGIAFVIVRTSSLMASHGNARSVSLDLHAQWEELERSGQFRFTPPTHVVLALAAALDALAREGGVLGRERRYRSNHRVLLEGMQATGVRAILRPELQSPVITAFHYPAGPRFHFEVFYRLLAECGLVIYPGKLTEMDSFRIGTIGQLTADDFVNLIAGIRSALDTMGIEVPVSA